MSITEEVVALKEKNKKLEHGLEMAKVFLMMAKTITEKLLEDLKEKELKLTTQSLELQILRKEYDSLKAKAE